MTYQRIAVLQLTIGHCTVAATLATWSLRWAMLYAGAALISDAWLDLYRRPQK